MRQVSNERAVYVAALHLQALDDCNRDVGMGPGHDFIITQAAKQLGLTAADYDHNHVLDLMRSNRR